MGLARTAKEIGRRIDFGLQLVADDSNGFYRLSKTSAKPIGVSTWLTGVNQVETPLRGFIANDFQATRRDINGKFSTGIVFVPPSEFPGRNLTSEVFYNSKYINQDQPYIPCVTHKGKVYPIPYSGLKNGLTVRTYLGNPYVYYRAAITARSVKPYTVVTIAIEDILNDNLFTPDGLNNYTARPTNAKISTLTDLDAGQAAEADRQLTVMFSHIAYFGGQPFPTPSPTTFTYTRRLHLVYPSDHYLRLEAGMSYEPDRAVRVSVHTYTSSNPAEAAYAGDWVQIERVAGASNGDLFAKLSDYLATTGVTLFRECYEQGEEIFYAELIYTKNSGSSVATLSMRKLNLTTMVGSSTVVANLTDTLRREVSSDSSGTSNVSVFGSPIQYGSYLDNQGNPHPLYQTLQVGVDLVADSTTTTTITGTGVVAIHFVDFKRNRVAYTNASGTKVFSTSTSSNARLYHNVQGSLSPKYYRGKVVDVYDEGTEQVTQIEIPYELALSNLATEEAALAATLPQPSTSSTSPEQRASQSLELFFNNSSLAAGTGSVDLSAAVSGTNARTVNTYTRFEILKSGKAAFSIPTGTHYNMAEPKTLGNGSGNPAYPPVAEMTFSYGGVWVVSASGQPTKVTQGFEGVTECHSLGANR